MPADDTAAALLAYGRSAEGIAARRTAGDAWWTVREEVVFLSESGDARARRTPSCTSSPATPARWCWTGGPSTATAPARPDRSCGDAVSVADVVGRSRRRSRSAGQRDAFRRSCSETACASGQERGRTDPAADGRLRSGRGDRHDHRPQGRGRRLPGQSAHAVHHRARRAARGSDAARRRAAPARRPAGAAGGLSPGHERGVHRLSGRCGRCDRHLGPHHPQPTLVECALAVGRQRQQLGRQRGRPDQ